MSIEVAWAVLKSRYQKMPQSTLARWGVEGGPVSPPYSRKLYSSLKDDFGDTHDAVYNWIENHPSIGTRRHDEGKPPRLMGLKPSDFHITVTAGAKHHRPKLPQHIVDNFGHISNDPLDLAYEAIANQIEDIKDAPSWYEEEDGPYSGHLEEEGTMRDEELSYLMGDIFGKRLYTLHAPLDAVLEAHRQNSKDGELTDEHIHDYLEGNGVLGLGRNWRENIRNEPAHAEHIDHMVPIGHMTMSGPHIGMIETAPELRGLGLGSLMGQQALAKEGALLSSYRTPKGQGFANRVMGLFGSKRANAHMEKQKSLLGRVGDKLQNLVGVKRLKTKLARQAMNLPKGVELGPLHDMQLTADSSGPQDDNDVDYHDDQYEEAFKIYHMHMPSKWGDLRPDISTVPSSFSVSQPYSHYRPNRMGADSPPTPARHQTGFRWDNDNLQTIYHTNFQTSIIPELPDKNQAKLPPNFPKLPTNNHPEEYLPSRYWKDFHPQLQDKENDEWGNINWDVNNQKPVDQWGDIGWSA